MSLEQSFIIEVQRRFQNSIYNFELLNTSLKRMLRFMCLDSFEVLTLLISSQTFFPRMEKFSSDRTIREYCSEIWGVKPVKIEIDAYS